MEQQSAPAKPSADPSRRQDLPWQLKLFSKTIKKKEKLKLLLPLIPAAPHQRFLDLGCAKGTLSYFLRSKGGDWVHADLDLVNLDEAASLLGNTVVRVGSSLLPFRNAAFDCVVSLDFIEHLEDDSQCLAEINRVLKPNGLLILSTPITGRRFILNRLKNLIGMKPEVYGHKREGYTLRELSQRLLHAGFTVRYQGTYSRFFTELVELTLNVAFTKVLQRRKRGPSPRDGQITVGSATEMRSHNKAFLAYSVLYPFTYAVAQLDRLIPFLKGYATLLIAQKQP